MPSNAAVARRDDASRSASPGVDDALDRLGGEAGPIGQADNGGLDLGSERGEPAAKRCPRPSLPVRTLDDRRSGAGQGIGPTHDYDLADRPGGAHPFQHAREEHHLLRRPETRRRPGREHDRRDHSDGGRDGLYVGEVNQAKGGAPETHALVFVLRLRGRPPELPRARD